MTGSARLAAMLGLVAAVVVVGLVVLTGGDDASEGGAAEASTAQTAAASSPVLETVPAPDFAPSTTAATEPTEAPATLVDLPDRGVHPQLLNIDGWLQSDVTSLEELRGDVVAVQFWTFGCSNCKATLEHMQELYAEHEGEGFEIVGIHAPEFSYEADVANIEAAAAELGVTWPIALDTEKRTFHSWQEGSRAFWPRIYLLDRDGHIRYDHIGEGRYEEIGSAVEALLAEPA